MPNYQKILLTLLFITTAIFASGQSNEGTEFWFAFMEHRDVNANTKVAMITSKTNTSGTISVPGQGWSQSFSVTANNVSIINLPAYTEVVGSESVNNVGIRITSNDPVSVYMHQYNGFRSEASVVLPNASIGNEYYVMTYQGVDWQSTPNPSEFLIVGVEDETNLTITVSDLTVGGKNPNTTFNVILNQGETYQVQSQKGTGDMTGSHIISENKFAVFGGASWTEVPVSCDARDN